MDKASFEIAGAQWWYRDPEGEKGPVSESVLRQLMANNQISSSAYVWREDFGDQWKRLDEAGLGNDLARTRPPAFPTAKGDGTWHETFAKFDQAEKLYFGWSVLGLIFGPLYYLYLRMWKKGFTIIGASLCASVLVAAFEALLNIPDLQWVVSGATIVFCGMWAKRDYYRLRRLGERMWPPLHWLDKPWAVAVLVIVPLIFTMVAISYADELADRSKKIATTAPKRISDSATSQLRSGWSPRETSTGNVRQLAEKNCQQWLEQNYGGKVANQYEDGVVYTYKIDLRGGDIIRNPTFFGGHQMMPFQAQLQKFVNGQLQEQAPVPEQVCVLNDDLQVIGAETSMEAGLR